MNFKDDDSRLFWISQNLFEYQDKGSGVKFHATIESGISVNDKYGTKNFPLRVKFEIKDKRVTHNGKTVIDLRYDTLTLFALGAKNMLNDGPQEAFQNGKQISIQRFYYKNKKELVCNVTEDNGFKIVMKIVDPTAGVQQGLIKMDISSFVTLINLMNNIIDNYTVISSTNLTTVYNERLLESINDLVKVVSNNHVGITEYCIDMSRKLGQLCIPVPQANGTLAKEIDVEEVEEIPPSDIQENFAEEFKTSSGFDGFELDGKQELNKRPMVEDSPSSFIGTFLQNDFSRLRSWIAGFLNSDDMNPFDEFMTYTLIPEVEKTHLITSPKYEDVQYILKTYMTTSIKNYLQDDSSSFPNDIPVLRFGCDIDKDKSPRLYGMAIDMLVTMLIYNIILTSSLNHFQGSDDQSNKIDEYKRVYFVFKLLTSTVMSSVVVNDYSILSDDIITSFNKALESNALFNIQQEYSAITMGGEITISVEMFNAVVNKFMPILKNSIPITIDDLDVVYERYSIPRTEQTYEEVNEPEEDVTAEPEEDVDDTAGLELSEDINNFVDPKLTLYKDIACMYARNLDESLTVGLDSLKDYDEIVDFLRNNTLPDRFYKVKRIMDINPEVDDKVQLKKLVSDFDEDSTVTQSRVIQEEFSEPEPEPEPEFSTDILDEL